MDINDIIKKCNFGNNIRSDSDDLYKNRIALESAYYANNDDSDENICTYIQMLYNINNGSQYSKGSSYEYTLDPTFNDNNLNNRETTKKHFKRNSNEYFSIGSNSENTYDIFYYILIFFIILFFFIYYFKYYLEK
jgi:hypothetical protein